MSTFPSWGRESVTRCRHLKRAISQHLRDGAESRRALTRLVTQVSRPGSPSRRSFPTIEARHDNENGLDNGLDDARIEPGGPPAALLVRIPGSRGADGGR